MTLTQDDFPFNLTPEQIADIRAKLNYRLFGKSLAELLQEDNTVKNQRQPMEIIRSPQVDEDPQ